MKQRRSINPTESARYRRECYLNNKDHNLSVAAIYRANHKAEEKINRRAHYQRNREHVLGVAKAYRLANLEMYAQAAQKRRAAKLQAIPSWADHDKIAAFYQLVPLVNEETGIPHEVDHIVPLQGKTVCGLHWEGNLQVIPMSENRGKSRFSWPDMP